MVRTIPVRRRTGKTREYRSCENTGRCHLHRRSAADANDLEGGKQGYILRTKGLNAGFDHWPEIDLARIELEPSKPERGIALALNIPIEQFPKEISAASPVSLDRNVFTRPRP